MEPEQINTIINKAWFTVRDQFIANIPAGEARDIASRAVGYYEAEIVSQLRNRDAGKE